MRRAVIAGALLGCSVAVTAPVGTPQLGGSGGQTVFLPVPRLGSEVRIVDEQPLEIESCHATSDGLAVSGWVSPRAGVREVLVTGGNEQMPGVRIGSAAWAHARPSSRAGEFRVILPWADDGATFALAVNDPGGDSAIAPVATCPEAP